MYAVQYGHKECIGYLLEQVQHDTIIDEAMEPSVVKFLRERGCEWSTNTTNRAAKQGDFTLLRYLHENGCPWNSDEIMDEVLEYFDSCALSVVQYLHEQGCGWTESTSSCAARKGYDKILHYLHENGCPWDERTSNAAAQFCRIDCLKYVLDNGCKCQGQAILKVIIEINYSIIATRSLGPSNHGLCCYLWFIGNITVFA